MDGLIQLLVVLILAGIVLLGLAVIAERVVGRVTIHEYERGVRMDRGRLVGLVGPGPVTFFRPTSEVQVVDTRPIALAVEGQEVLTSDGVAVKVSLVLRSAVGDPVARLQADQDTDRLLYLLVQLALREVVAGLPLDDVLAARTTMGPTIRDLVAGRMGEIGIELLSVDVRDVMVPAEMKRAQAAVVVARHEAAASLERARGETAALRNLANAGRLLDDHPGLLALRLVQELGERGGNTVVLGLPEGAGAVTDPVVKARRRGGSTDPD